MDCGMLMFIGRISVIVFWYNSQVSFVIYDAQQVLIAMHCDLEIKSNEAGPVSVSF